MALSILKSTFSSLQKLATRRQKELRDECQRCLERLKALEEELTDEGRPAGEEEGERDAPAGEASGAVMSALSVQLYASAEDLFKPFQMACESNTVKLVLIALDSIQKLLVYGFFSGPLKEKPADVEAEKDGKHGSAAAAHQAEGDRSRHGWGHEAPLLLIDKVVKVICACSELQDDAVHLQIIRCLLTAVTTTTTAPTVPLLTSSDTGEDRSTRTVINGTGAGTTGIPGAVSLGTNMNISIGVGSNHVHGPSLMKAVQTIFQIHRDSRDVQNQRTAQASLTQMLNVVMSRMEFSSSAKPPLVWEPLKRPVGDVLHEGGDASPQPDPELLLNEWLRSHLTKLVDDVCRANPPTAEAAGTAADGETPTGEGVGEAAASEGARPLLNELGYPCGKFGWCIVCRRPAKHYCIETKDPVCSHACKHTNLYRLNSIDAFLHPAAERQTPELQKAVGVECDGRSGVQTSSPTPSPASDGETELEVRVEGLSMAPRPHIGRPTGALEREMIMSLHQRDALMVFQSLCKLSMKDIPEPQQASIGMGMGLMAPTTQPDQRIVRSKRLSLELILSMLQNSGPVFKNSERFLQVLRNLLCFSLVKNSVSHIPRVFGLSLSIFLVLVANFKDHLRTEIGVFVEQIFLKILESGNSSFEHKHRVLQVFYKLCTDATIALELFLNWDACVGETDIFARLIECLSRIAQGKYTSTEHTNLILPQQQAALQMVALKALVTLMGSVVDWVRRATEDAEQPASHLEEQETEEDDFASEAEKDRMTAQAAAGSASSSQVYQQRLKKAQLQRAIAKFNIKPKKGIEYLISTGQLQDDPEAIARFLLTQEGLDKTLIGDYLGEDKSLNQKVLYALIDLQDFAGLELDLALRRFISSFRLPGEAQKIDRMMEKFAEKYIRDNPDKIFANADSCYVLSFSLIMLHTDAHSSQIRPENKMTKEDFIRNNRGINDSQDLPKEYLETLYDRVVSEEWLLPEDQGAKARMESMTAAGRKKFELFLRETRGIVTRSTELIKKKEKKKESPYIVATAETVEYVRFLFEVACWPLLATFSVLLETQDDSLTVEGCLEGFKHCVRIASRFDMPVELESFVSSLAKFTYLTTLKEIKGKNIECIKTLLSIGLADGNNLGHSWLPLLQCISQLERLQQKKGKEDFLFFSSQSPTSAGSHSQAQIPSRFTHQLHQGHTSNTTAASYNILFTGDDAQAVEQMNAENVMAQIDTSAIERLFSRSVLLSSGEIVQFVTQLCAVSIEELSNEQPRIFALQKLVEVASGNMNRIRWVWNRIWTVLRVHFAEVAMHHNRQVCMYVIDSLRQLAWKFLEKDELSNYHFQVEFLRPFEMVMSNSQTSSEIKELIVQIMSNMVMMRARNIKSGWMLILRILNSAAHEKNPNLVQQSLTVVEAINSNTETLIENFSETVKVLTSFACSADSEVAIRAIELMKSVADKLGSQIKAEKAVEDAVSLYWFPLLSSLSSLVSDKRTRVRRFALDVLFDVLDRHGSRFFGQDTWQMAFRGILFPLMDDIHHGGEFLRVQLGATWPTRADSSSTVTKDVEAGQQAGTLVSQPASTPDAEGKEKPSLQPFLHHPPQQFATSTCFAALQHVIVLFDRHFETINFEFGDVLTLLVSSAEQPTEIIARIGVEAFRRLLRLSGSKFNAAHWVHVSKNLQDLFRATTPRQLLETEEEFEEPGSLQAEFQEFVEKTSLEDSTRTETTSKDCRSQPPTSRSRQSEPSEALPSGGHTSAPRHSPSPPKPPPPPPPPSSGPTTPPDSPATEKPAPSEKRRSLLTFAGFGRGKPPDLPSPEAQEASSVPVQETSSTPLGFDCQEVVTRSIVQLELIALVQEVSIPNVDCLPGECLLRLLDSLLFSFSFASQFNRKVQWRQQLKERGFMVELKQLPGLLKQEREGLKSILRIMFCAAKCRSTAAAPLRTFIVEKLTSLIRSVLRDYIAMDKMLHAARAITSLSPSAALQKLETERELTGLTPIVAQQILLGLSDADRSQFQEHMDDLLPALCDLICVEQCRDAKVAELRLNLRTLILSWLQDANKTETRSRSS
uniref:SEC7 domain-containing protein n=1 Tax=Vitrella brassicaformis TaxID=1169539 RepID=A0A7S1PDF6_9ALVE|mmetsp:Transcript_5930/g.14187  ORF Transcript_5930/g.14187 Transcript_5930/m.14187 type:complete len:2051 (+) Transcript_5930:24-6176(+)